MGLLPVFTASGRTSLPHSVGQVLTSGPDGRIQFAWRKFDAHLILPPTQALTAGNGVIYWQVAEALDGAVLTSLAAYVVTASSSGAVSLQLHDVGRSLDLLSTTLTIDAGEQSSRTAATPCAIDSRYQTLYAGQVLRVDAPGAGSGTEGLQLSLSGYLGGSTTAPEAAQLGDQVQGTATIGAAVSEGMKSGDSAAS